MASNLEEVVEVLLDEYFGEAVNWRQALEGRAILVDAQRTSDAAEVSTVTFKATGVRQVAPPTADRGLSGGQALARVGDWLREEAARGR